MADGEEAQSPLSRHDVTESLHLGLDSFPFRPTSFYQGKPSVVFTSTDKNVLLESTKPVLVGKFTHGKPPFGVIKEFFVSLKLRGYEMWVFKWDSEFSPFKESLIAPVWIRIEGDFTIGKVFDVFPQSDNNSNVVGMPAGTHGTRFGRKGVVSKRGSMLDDKDEQVDTVQNSFQPLELQQIEEVEGVGATTVLSPTVVDVGKARTVIDLQQGTVDNGHILREMQASQVLQAVSGAAVYGAGISEQRYHNTSMVQGVWMSSDDKVEAYQNRLEQVSQVPISVSQAVVGDKVCGEVGKSVDNGLTSGSDVGLREELRSFSPVPMTDLMEAHSDKANKKLTKISWLDLAEEETEQGHETKGAQKWSTTVQIVQIGERPGIVKTALLQLQEKRCITEMRAQRLPFDDKG
ncbi:hypothetical protein LIER_25558 [Lithospermum erythrorhizon]|uniref:DUF4283 domain-containing protein n=1 Tax=Lithospermum erythrorhizon TaxID=34254 RepID=A0AAV3R993_LITER